MFLQSCFLTLAALDSKCILLESASLHIFHKCNMYLLTVPSFNHLHFHRPWNYRGSKQYGLSVLNKHLGNDKFGGMTSRICGQATKRYPKWRHPMMNFFLLWRGISLGPDTLWKLKQQSVTQPSVVFLLVITKNIRFPRPPRKKRTTCSKCAVILYISHEFLCKLKCIQLFATPNQQPSQNVLTDGDFWCLQFIITL